MKHYKKQVFIGWVCRCWTETSLEGWTSEFETFDTEQEAIDCGINHNRMLGGDELSREFEVYKKFTSPF